jgi:hypothetical protein
MATAEGPHGMWDPELDGFLSPNQRPASRGESREPGLHAHRAPAAEKPSIVRFLVASQSPRFSLAAGVVGP